MATLSPGISVTTGDPVLLVENQFTAGQYRFQLVVTDDAGNDSDPAELVVTVRAPAPPPPPPGHPHIPIDILKTHVPFEVVKPPVPPNVLHNINILKQPK